MSQDGDSDLSGDHDPESHVLESTRMYDHQYHSPTTPTFEIHGPENKSLSIIPLDSHLEHARFQMGHIEAPCGELRSSKPRKRVSICAQSQERGQTVFFERCSGRYNGSL